MLASATGSPARAGLRISEEVLIGQQVLMGQRRERLAHLEHGPQQQPFGFLAVVVEGRFRIDEAGEPRADRVEIIAGGNLGDAAPRAIVALAAVQFWRDGQGFDGLRGEQQGGHWGALKLIGVPCVCCSQ